MRFERACAAAAAFAGLIGCLKFDPFACSEDPQCDLDSSAGFCQVTGFCAYPDFGCPSGLRYGDHAGAGLGGTCVAGVTDTEATDESSTSGSTTEPTTDTDSTADTGETGASETDTDGDCGGPGQPCCDGAAACEDGLTCAGSACGCAAKVVTGQRHSCAIKVDGSVWCWGANGFGQVRTPAGDPEPTPVMVPGVVAAGTEALALSARNHTCALRDDMLAVCWGHNDAGQSDPMDEASSVAPSEASWAQPARGVAAGAQHTCALRSEDIVASCWGANNRNQLTTEAPGPGPIDIPGALVLEQIALGDEHGCGVTQANEVWCWGDNAQGQLAADPMLVPTSDVLGQVAVPEVDEIVAGARHTCARSGNDVLCWGRNNLGQLGDGSGVQQSIPAMVALPPGLTVTGIASGPDHTCAIAQGGELWCWGSNTFGQLMLEPDAMGNDTYTLTPVEMNVGADVLAFAGGATHSCALVNTGALVCWGTNTEGQIGDGSMTYAHTPKVVDLACP
jgi:alpha-tubulin suppressor-like RCC1 family protein